MAEAQYLSAQEAASQLGISTGTLYSYVSRGMLRSEAADGKSRAKRYLAEDVRKLKRRQSVRYSPERAAQQALSFGSPVLDSAITLIKDGRLFYRGHDAVALAQTNRFEEVATLLWTGKFDATDRLFEQATSTNRIPPHPADPPPALSPIERFQTVLPAAAAQDLAAYDFSAEAVQQTGVRILRLLTETAANQPLDHSIANTLRRAWLPKNDDATKLIEAALILCADHELNASAFTARCVASARATPYQAVIAGLAALSGYRHGGAASQVLSFFHEADGDVPGAIKRTMQRGRKLPGIGHALYRQGDPRSRFLLELIDTHAGDSAGATLAREILHVIDINFGRFPNLDFGLAALTRALELPDSTPVTLFAIGRTAGWLAHIIEQYSDDQLIRPRARYIGPDPLNPTEKES